MNPGDDTGRSGGRPRSIPILMVVVGIAVFMSGLLVVPTRQSGDVITTGGNGTLMVIGTLIFMAGALLHLLENRPEGRREENKPSMSFTEPVEGMVMECPRCGAENPDFAVYCSSCSEGIRELAAPGAPGKEESTPVDPENGPVRLAPEPSRPVIVRRRTYTVATYTALVALILLALGFSLYVYYYERQLGILMDTPPNYEDLRSLFDIAKASTYSRMFGEVAAVLALILIIQGALSMQHQGSIMLTFRREALVNTWWVLLLALSLACMACACMIIVYEFEPDLDMEGARVVSRLLQYTSQVAWIFVTLSLLLIANGLRRRA